MAKLFVDAATSTSKDSMVRQDGTALTLTGAARILYDDTLSKRDLSVLIERIIDFLESEPTMPYFDVKQAMIDDKLITIDGLWWFVTED